MRWYNDIPIWENTERINTLIEYKSLIIGYFNNISYDYPFKRNIIENEKASEYRSKINLMMMKVHSIVICSEAMLKIGGVIPAAGISIKNIELITNIFNLHLYNIEPKTLLDQIETVIGVYKNDRTKAWRRTFNPFYWFLRILDLIVSVPFLIMGRVGFNQAEIEGSFIGRLFKGIVYLVGIVITFISGIAAFLEILEKWGYLERFKNLFK